MERQRVTLVTLFLLGVLLLAEAALATPSAPTSLTKVTSSRRDLSTIPSQTVNAVAGNVTQISIDALAITDSWQGYYGNVSGTIGLWDGNNNTFYNWSMATAVGEVYAARSGTITWSNIQCANSTEIAAEEAALGQSASDADSVSNTFTSTTHPALNVGSVAISANTCPATNAFNASGAQSSTFFQILLDDGTNRVYTTPLNSSVGFNGQTWDFELLVGEDGHGNTATTPYYFFVELG